MHIGRGGPHELLLTSSEVELMETFLLHIGRGGPYELLLTSSEVELMETINPWASSVESEFSASDFLGS